MTEEVKRWWEATANEFQNAIDLDAGVDWTMYYREDLELLGDVAGADVLELGCGGGQCAVALAERGANLTGIDLSVAQLAHARDLVAEHGVDVDLVQGDVTDLGAFEDEAFDVAFNAYVFQWVEDLAACFEETYRVLRPGGRFVFTTPHPFERIVDSDTHRVEGSYFDTGRHVVVDERRDANLVTYRSTVSDYYNGLVGAGFDVERMLEPGSSDPETYEPGPWGEHPPELTSTVPDVLGFVSRKPD